MAELIFGTNYLQQFFSDEDYPTCEYNSGVLKDLRCLENEEFVSEVLGRSPQLRDALVLLKVWARQRELHLGHGAFTGHLLAFLLAYLLHIRKLNLAMSSYQITRTVWNYLSEFIVSSKKICAFRNPHRGDNPMPGDLLRNTP